jgi:hypothetical protein
MILVEFRRANAEGSAGELLDTDFEADSLYIALEEQRVEFAIRQECHTAAGDVKLMVQ